jgi:hypothetical protein
MINLELIAVSILMFAGALWAGSLIDAQERILDCLPADDTQVFTYGHGVSEVSPWEWQGYQDITGESIVEGDEYKRGEWHVPLDVEHVLTLRNVAPVDEQWLVWVWWSPSNPGHTYWFVFDHVIPDEPGVLHPCGVYVADLEIWR